MDDFLGKKKDTAPILDLSRQPPPQNKEEFRRLWDKVPDFKIKPEKIKAEDIKIREKNFKFKTNKKDYKAMKEAYLFMDPIPQEMKGLSVKDLAAVPIDWKMLTTVRPKAKIDEEFFGRVVELRKLEMKTELNDKKNYAQNTQIRRFKNKAGVVEQRVIACPECLEDFCNTTSCSQLSYEGFTRIPIEIPQTESLLPNKLSSKKLGSLGGGGGSTKDESTGNKQKKKTKKLKKKTTTSTKRSKSKSPRKKEKSDNSNTNTNSKTNTRKTETSTNSTKTKKISNNKINKNNTRSRSKSPKKNHQTTTANK